jgi:uncharacterized protein (TIGR00255 family)
VEVRAVNHRFLDLKVRGAALDPRLEEAIGAAVRRKAERGSFTITIRSAGAGSGAEVDVELARRLHGALQNLAAHLGYNEPVPLAVVLAQPGVVRSAEVPADPAALAPAIDAALDELVAMRRREGVALAADLAARLDRLEAFADDVSARAAAAPAEHRRRLSERVAKLLDGTSVAIDEGRLAQEVALVADRTDVTEELVRLRSHIAQARALLGDDGPVGRRLDFLVQELGREVNTIGSKTQLVDVTRRVLDAKAEIEKIREQVQNVE